MRTLTLLILALLLCGCNTSRETLDWSTRPQPDAISQPYGRYPLASPVPTYFDRALYVSPDAALSDTDRAALTAALDNTVQPILTDAIAYANSYCLPSTQVYSEQQAIVRVRLYYGPFPRRGSFTPGQQNGAFGLGQPAESCTDAGCAVATGLKQPSLATPMKPDLHLYDPAAALRRASAALTPPRASSGYSGLCQLVASGNTLHGAQVWLNTAPLYDFLQQAKLLYPYDTNKQLAWAVAQWIAFVRLVMPHELVGHAYFGMPDEPRRPGPGMMHNRWLSGIFNGGERDDPRYPGKSAEEETANWLRVCKARSTSSLKITAEDW